MVIVITKLHHSNNLLCHLFECYVLPNRQGYSKKFRKILKIENLIIFRGLTSLKFIFELTSLATASFYLASVIHTSTVALSTLNLHISSSKERRCSEVGSWRPHKLRLCDPLLIPFFHEHSHSVFSILRLRYLRVLWHRLRWPRCL